MFNTFMTANDLIVIPKGSGTKSGQCSWTLSLFPHNILYNLIFK